MALSQVSSLALSMVAGGWFEGTSRVVPEDGSPVPPQQGLLEQVLGAMALSPSKCYDPLR